MPISLLWTRFTKLLMMFLCFLLLFRCEQQVLDLITKQNNLAALFQQKQMSCQEKKVELTEIQGRVQEAEDLKKEVIFI